MKPKLKTKTVIDVLQSLRLIPSFTAQFSGDVLPEAVLLKNIMEEMMSSISTLSGLNSLFNQKTDIGNILQENGVSEKLNQAIRKLHASIVNHQATRGESLGVEGVDTQSPAEIKDHDYDADNEAEQKTSSRRPIRKRDSTSTKRAVECKRKSFVKESLSSLKEDGGNS